ncbi:hypothetical protein EDF22_0188 [Rathayibacter sp. PhB127]|uniref:hypothetical protein n=1 Tax=Rathayibacter sp. PhB127 TaxID=2485176 RepID=UPI000F4D0903|nr:hypothetical protein [Rathayibacter sp. PhB127]ROS28464.1 hypothetical protein EDF22_0188 [Rathayibacter sp. PhB127]
MSDLHVIPPKEWRSELARARTRRDHGSDEFLAAVARVADSGVSQTEIAGQLRASQPQVSRWAAKGRRILGLVAEGRMLGRSPYHVAERYSRGEISREQVVEALTTWQYVTAETRTGGLHEDLLNVVAGSFDEVQAASLDDLIDEDVYAAALDALRAQTASLRQTDGE